MTPLAVFSICAVFAAALGLVVARERARQAAQLEARLRELQERLEAAEHAAEQAQLAAHVAGSVLLEKGLADEEDLDAARRHLEADDAPPAPRTNVH